MKKVTYFLAVILTLTLVSVSCTKEDDPKFDGSLITLIDLHGAWNFVSYNYDGTEYNCTSTALPKYMDNVFLALTFDIAKMTVNVDAACDPNGGFNYDFTKDLNVIKFDRIGISNPDEVRYIFTVVSYTGNQLKLRLDKTPFIYNYPDGILTFMR